MSLLPVRVPARRGGLAQLPQHPQLRQNEATKRRGRQPHSVDARTVCAVYKYLTFDLKKKKLWASRCPVPAHKCFATEMPIVLSVGIWQIFCKLIFMEAHACVTLFVWCDRGRPFYICSFKSNIILSIVSIVTNGTQRELGSEAWTPVGSPLLSQNPNLFFFRFVEQQKDNLFRNHSTISDF